MKRRLTQNEVARITHMGAPATMSGRAASCELPANTRMAISSTSIRLMPDLAMATPVIKPQAAIPGATAASSLAPMRNSGCLNNVFKKPSFLLICRRPAEHHAGLDIEPAQKIRRVQRFAAGFLQTAYAQHPVDGR